MTNSIVSINLKSKSHSESTSPAALYKTEQSSVVFWRLQ